MTDWSIEMPSWLAPLVSDFGPLHPDADAHMIPMRDGTRLATDVYLPRPLRGKAPTVLMRTCYDKSGSFINLMDAAICLREEGFAVVTQDVRGRFRSEGDRTPFFHEVNDGYDTLEWISQQAWSDGTVGMYGTSYLGFAQWAAAASGHSALRALSLGVTSQVVPTNWWGRQISSPAGGEWLATEWSCAARIEGNVLDWTRRPFIDAIPPDLANARRLLLDMRTQARDDAALQRQAFRDGLPAPRLRIPALHAGGWWDPLNRWMLQDWHVAANYAPAAHDQYLLMSATNHMGAHFGDDGDGASLPPSADVAMAPSIAFFDKHLRKGGGKRTIPRVRYESAHGTWYEALSWPPDGVREWTLHLADAARATTSLVGGGLSTKPDAVPSIAAWIHDPTAPVPALTQDVARPVPHEAAVHLRPDVATFTSDPVPRTIELVGPVLALLTFESSAPSSHVIATLIDLAPDGTVYQLMEGISWVDTLQGPVMASIDLGSIAYRLRRGHRLRLAVASSRFPSYLPHPGTNDDPWTAVATRPAHQGLRTGGSMGSRLMLSVRARR